MVRKAIVWVLFVNSIVCFLFCPFLFCFVLFLFFGWDRWAGLFLVGLVFLFLFLFGEFDPGSGRTLAACLTHASRTGSKGFLFLVRVANG